MYMILPLLALRSSFDYTVRTVCSQKTDRFDAENNT